jgi:uncharacterized protein YdeI (YjbR/CyaY-like superfamily)
MGTKDARVDAYIRDAAPFARPVLTHLRRVVHAAAPGIGETIKWGFPHFEQNGIVCSMAAFKTHCGFGFWKGRQILGGRATPAESAMGQFGRITSVADLPPEDELGRWVRKAVELNAERAATPRRKAAPRRPARAAVVPAALRRALEASPAAQAGFRALSPSQRREYAQWVAEAKQEETRERRLRTAVEWLAEGKPRNWKYMRGGARGVRSARVTATRKSR